VTARQFTNLQISEDELAAPGQIERSPRVVAAPELVASAEEALVGLHDNTNPPTERPRANGGSEPRATVNG
jgi:DNA recombination protein RmuC